VFEPDDEGHSVALVQDLPADLVEAARRGEANCPERAITIDEN